MIHRRDAMLRLGQVAVGGLTLPKLLHAENRAGTAPAVESLTAGKAKSCILIYLWGGPPQMDTWDPKTEAAAEIRTQFSAIDTVVPGIRFTDQLPLMARHADKMAVVRSFTHPSNQHEVGVYHTLTGKINNSLGVPRNARNRNDFPNVGSVVSYFTPPGVMPASVTIPRPIGHDGVTYTGTYAGFLGAKYDPLELKAPAEVNTQAPHNIDLPPELAPSRLQSRLGLLKYMEHQDRILQATGGAGPYTYNLFRDRALGLLLSQDAKAAFDVEREPETMREAYGRNEYGEGILLARRLVEAGVRLVTMTWYHVCKDGNVANVWDNHGGSGSLGGATGYQMLKEWYCLPSLDRAYSALMEDLSQRGLLDETLVVMVGEFGRTPKINTNAGRDHWGACQSVVLAGGGVRGGQVYGSSDINGAYPTSNPVSPEDLIATMYYSMGIDHEYLIYDRERRPHRLTEGQPVDALFG